MDEDNKLAMQIALETYTRYWSWELDRVDHALQMCMNRIKKCSECGDEIGVKTWLLIMLAPAMIMTSSIEGIKKYFDTIVKETDFTYAYEKEHWNEIILTLLSSHIEIVRNMKGDVVNLETAEPALRLLLMDTTLYLDKLKLFVSIYTVSYILPLEVAARAVGLTLNDVITVNKTIYAAIRRNKKALSLVGKNKKLSPSVETTADFANLLVVYNMALSAGYIPYRDARLINKALTEGNFEAHGSLESVSLADNLDFPEVEVGDVSFSNN